jgi:hypothetical protein
MMADARTAHLLQRSVRKLAVDLVRDSDKRHTANADTVLAEREEQVQLEVRGTATATMAFTTIDVPFQQCFSRSNSRRNSQFDRPHVWFGFELLSATEVPAGSGGFGGSPT